MKNWQNYTSDRILPVYLTYNALPLMCIYTSCLLIVLWYIQNNLTFYHCSIRILVTSIDGMPAAGTKTFYGSNHLPLPCYHLHGAAVATSRVNYSVVILLAILCLGVLLLNFALQFHFQWSLFVTCPWRRTARLVPATVPMIRIYYRFTIRAWPGFRFEV